MLGYSGSHGWTIKWRRWRCHFFCRTVDNGFDKRQHDKREGDGTASPIDCGLSASIGAASQRIRSRSNIRWRERMCTCGGVVIHWSRCAWTRIVRSKRRKAIEDVRVREDAKIAYTTVLHCQRTIGPLRFACFRSTAAPGCCDEQPAHHRVFRTSGSPLKNMRSKTRPPLEHGAARRRTYC
eukprot:SAG31_NODE_2547_length_5528_cov_4.438202_1_plen_181_part_00